MKYSDYRKMLNQFQQNDKEKLEEVIVNQNTNEDCNMSEMFDYYADEEEDFSLLLSCWDIHY